jgi:synaptogyrin, putative
LIVFCCVHYKGWSDGKCSYNQSGNACRFGTLLGLIGFLGAVVLIVFEALFQNISSIKVRKRIVAFDLIFSGLWSGLSFICFAYLGIAWSKSSYPDFGYGINNLRAAIFFSLFCTLVWAGCAYFAWLRWKSGTDMSVFASGYEEGEAGSSADYYPYVSGTNPNDATFQNEGVYSSTTGDHYTSSDPRSNFQAPSY